MANMFISGGFEDAPIVGSRVWSNGSLFFLSRRVCFEGGFGILV